MGGARGRRRDRVRGSIPDVTLRMRLRTRCRRWYRGKSAAQCEPSGYVGDYKPAGRIGCPPRAGGADMLDRLLADAVVVFHLLFIAFAVAGGLLVMRWR